MVLMIVVICLITLIAGFSIGFAVGARRKPTQLQPKLDSKKVLEQKAWDLIDAGLISYMPYEISDKDKTGERFFPEQIVVDNINIQTGDLFNVIAKLVKSGDVGYTGKHERNCLTKLRRIDLNKLLVERMEKELGMK